MPLFSAQMDYLVPFLLGLELFAAAHILGKYNYIFLLWLLLVELVGCLFFRSVGLTAAMMMTSLFHTLGNC